MDKEQQIKPRTIYDPSILKILEICRKNVSVSESESIAYNAIFLKVVVIGIDTKIKVVVVSPTTWEAHHNPRAKLEGCGELPRSLVTQQ